MASDIPIQQYIVESFNIALYLQVQDECDAGNPRAASSV